VSYRVRFSPEAEADLLRCFEFVLERELLSPTGDPRRALVAQAAIQDGLRLLERHPHTCRRHKGPYPQLRELVIQHGSSGYVALFEIVNPAEVYVARIRHQREDDLR
jgi:plasmid stabilization system protein ParE